MKRATALLLSIILAPALPAVVVARDGALDEWTRQRQAQHFRGLSNAIFFPVQVSESARGCGLRADALNTSAEFVIGQSRLVVKFDPNKPPDAYIDVSINALALPGRQACSFVLDLVVTVPAKSDRTGVSVTGNVHRSGTMGIGPRETFQRQVIDALELKLKEFLVIFNEANRQ